ncbi:hypothetical protein F5X97DRAFT_329693 [Nemania serpens]|nr:hypothetical protein F5X97DRAFT_329693 [Nemania serpens]
MLLFKFCIYFALPLQLFAFDGLPTVCPHIAVRAGTTLSARIINPWAKPCQAQLRFADADILPVTFNFSPIACLGFQIAQFTVPLTSPNGDAFVSWECGGQQTPACLQLTISNGLGWPDMSVQPGTSGCVFERTQTITDIVIHTAGSSVVTTETLTTVLTIPVTSLAPAASPLTVPSPFPQSENPSVESTAAGAHWTTSESVMITSGVSTSAGLNASATATRTKGAALTGTRPALPASNLPGALVGSGAVSGTPSIAVPSSLASSQRSAVSDTPTGKLVQGGVRSKSSLVPSSSAPVSTHLASQSRTPGSSSGTVIAVPTGSQTMGTPASGSPSLAVGRSVPPPSSVILTAATTVTVFVTSIMSAACSSERGQV